MTTEINEESRIYLDNLYNESYEATDENEHDDVRHLKALIETRKSMIRTLDPDNAYEMLDVLKGDFSIKELQKERERLKIKLDELNAFHAKAKIIYDKEILPKEYFKDFEKYYFNEFITQLLIDNPDYELNENRLLEAKRTVASEIIIDLEMIAEDDAYADDRDSINNSIKYFKNMIEGPEVNWKKEGF